MMMMMMMTMMMMMMMMDGMPVTGSSIFIKRTLLVEDVMSIELNGDGAKVLSVGGVGRN